MPHRDTSRPLIGESIAADERERREAAGGRAHVHAILARLDEPGRDSRAFIADTEEMLDLIERDPEAADELLKRAADLELRLDGAKNRAAAVMAQIGWLNFAIAEHVPPKPEDARPFFASSGPAADIALAALHIIRYAGDVVTLSPDAIQAAMEEPDADPDYGDYPAVFAAAVAHMSTSAYYVLDAHDSYAALASDPPDQETFPPLPFPRLWLEMSHLAPYMRLVDNRERDARWKALDVLGIGIAEIEQGRVWDVFVPFQFDEDAEFFFLAARIIPGGIVSCDATIEPDSAAFAEMRRLAVGGVHLVTARNVPVREVTMPRGQRKRLAATLATQLPRIYYVDLASAGEDAGAAATGPRGYSVRWLVRGHWRHVPGGRTFCTCCDPARIASWVAPFVKGPVGAPWKGRQVRRTASDVANEPDGANATGAGMMAGKGRRSDPPSAAGGGDHGLSDVENGGRDGRQ